MLCVFLDMSHAAQPSSSPSPPPPLLHLLSDLWPHTDIMLTSGPHLSLCPQTSCVFSSPTLPNHLSPPQKKKRKVIALFCDQPPPSPVLCLAPPTGGRCFWLTCLLFFLSLSLSISLSLCLLPPKQPSLVFLLWGLFTCSCGTFLDVPHSMISACRVQK